MLGALVSQLLVLFTLTTILVLGCSASANVATAERAVIHFHELADSGRFIEIFEQSSDELKNASTQSAFVALLEAVHHKLGNTKSSLNQSWGISYHESGTLITLTYKTVYTEGDAVEQFVFRIEGKFAMLVDYHIQETRPRNATTQV